MSNLTPFVFESYAVRVVTDDAGEPLFVAKDVATALGYINPSDAISRHCKGVVERYPLQTSGGDQEARVIREPDLYRLIFKSTLPSAQAFERLVVEDILPSIRKTGQYAAPTTPGEALVQMAQNFLRHERQILDLERQQHDIASQVRALVQGEDYVSVIGWGNIHGKRIDANTASRIGKTATALCKNLGYTVGKVTHPLFGVVNTYPREVLDQLAEHQLSTWSATPPRTPPGIDPAK